MKSIPAALNTHYATHNTRVATAIKITRPDGVIIGLTTHDRDDTISSVVYKSNPGLTVTSVDLTSGTAVGNMELTTLHDGSLFSVKDVLSGAWRNSVFLVFRYNWNSISDGIENILAGTFGEVDVQQNMVVVELRDLRQYLQQSVGSASSRMCRYRLGSIAKNNGGLCLLNLAPFTHNGSLTGVVSNTTFSDSASVQPDDYFGNGTIEFTSGNNEGYIFVVRSFVADVFTLALRTYGVPQVGDTYTAIAGCRHRLVEDCKDKFNNVINFGGEPHRLGLNSLTKAPDGSV